ncbi:MAG: universal stress protein [Leptolyngbyaceae cyanobacterium MO_188.B28]|nr:universal stress protein [Leptolyngbyaceae cyanobacterium MO_188.B28]
MVSKILVAMDRSDLSSAAFNQAMSLAKAVDARLILLHVLSHAEEDSPQLVNVYGAGYYSEVNEILWQTYEQEWNAFVQEYEELLKWRTNEAKMAGVKAEFIHTSGSPGRTICEVARDKDIDLIVIGSHGRAGLRELFLGSVSNYVMHHAPCSVLVSHPREQTEPQHTALSPREEQDQATSAPA